MNLSHDEPAQKYNKARGIIQDIAYFGSHSTYYVRLPSGFVMQTILLNAQRWAAEEFTWNDDVWISWGDNSGVVLTS
jgi:putrescine transport system ATP-binding protein